MSGRTEKRAASATAAVIQTTESAQNIDDRQMVVDGESRETNELPRKRLPVSHFVAKASDISY